MPKVAIFLAIVLLTSSITHSYAFLGGDTILQDTNQSNFTFDSDIIDIDSQFFTSNEFKRYLIFGSTNNIDSLLETNSIYDVKSSNGFFSVATLSEQSVSNLIQKGYYVIEDYHLDFHESEILDASRVNEITGASLTEKNYQLSGNGVKIGIVDTGVDFSNLDIRHSLARDKINHPIMLDSDGQGIVITNATFYANIDKNGIIRNIEKPPPAGFTSKVIVSKDGVFLDISQKGSGTKVPIYNSFFPQAGSSPIFNGTLTTDMKIGEDNRNYIKSESGTYRLGVIYQGALQGPLARIQVVPVLVVDSFSPGIYDKIIPDMSTSWNDYTRFELKSGEEPNYDFDFTDEKPIVLGSGNEFLVYDSNDDGKIDYSAGTIGAHVLDIYNVVQDEISIIDDNLKATNGTLLEPFDSNGEYFGIMTDFMGHGTSSAASIISKGEQHYDIYNNTKKFVIKGVAPDAKIVPVKALWFGDTVYAWLWLAGFENQNNKWEFSGKPNVDIISNSWGVSNFPSFKSAPGMDILSNILNVLVTPHSLDDDFPGVTIVSSAGNAGHGYGTIGLPNAASFGISVGATTNNVFVDYGPFKDQPRFGNGTEHFGNVVDFSSRGPGILGDPKPDLMSVGAHGFTPSNMLKTEKDSKLESFSLFGGTSMAAPLVSGTAAILMEDLNSKSIDYNPFMIKNILMSTANDLQNDPFTQGSGSVNVYDAIKYVNGNDDVFIVHNDASYNNIKKITEPTFDLFNFTSLGLENYKQSSKSFPMTSWFAGHLNPGERSLATFTIENPTNNEIEISIKPQSLQLIQKTQLSTTTIPHEQDPILNKTGTYAPNYIKLSDVREHTNLDEFFDDENPIPSDSSLMILNVNYDFDNFMNSTALTYADDLKISSLYVYDWLDYNNDTKISSQELSLVNRAGSWGTVQELRVSEPNKKFDGTPVVGVYPVPIRYSYWLGATNQNSTAMDYTLSASYYQKENWSVIWSNSETVTVMPNGSAEVNVTLVVPEDLQTGVYQGFLTFQNDKHTVNAPVSFVIKEPINQVDSLVVIDGNDSDDMIFGNGFVKGAFDMANRYLAGDWRQYYFDIQDESINTGAIELSWKDDDTNLALFVMDPKGRIVQTNVPSGVFGHFLGWPSLDWLGTSPFSQGGGFFPVKNKDDTSTVIYVPINQTGTYSLLAHSTLFGGNSTTESLTLAAKFTNISSEYFEEPEILNPPTDIIPNQIEQVSINNTTTIEDLSIKESSKTVETTDVSTSITETNEPSFVIGIGLGIGIGIAIGIGILIIVIQKTRK